MRAVSAGRREGALKRWAIMGAIFVGAWSIGCVLEGGDGDGGLFEDLSTPTDDGEWMEDAEDRRRERDDPRSVNFRGDFEVKLLGERVNTSIDGAELGEATFKHVGEDLVGTPPHCQITLADRQPDASGAQGYLIMQIMGADCDVQPGEFTVYGSWQQAREQGEQSGVILKTVQVTVETDAESTYYDYRQAQGVLEITQVERGELIQAYVDAEMTRLMLNDDAEQAANMKVEGGFGAVTAP